MVSDWLAQNKTFELLDVDFTDHGRSGIWRGELMVEEGGRVRPWAWNGETVRSDPC
jgi:hypothetical protein